MKCVGKSSCTVSWALIDLRQSILIFTVISRKISFQTKLNKQDEMSMESKRASALNDNSRIKAVEA